MEKKEFIKDVDYYLEEGRVIFTAKYLSERLDGCCRNSCRHCPYFDGLLRSADGTYGSWGTSGNDNKIPPDDNKS